MDGQFLILFFAFRCISAQRDFFHANCFRMRSRKSSRASTTSYSSGMSLQTRFPLGASARSSNRSNRPVTVLYMPSADETKYFDTSFGGTVSSAADWTGSEVACTNYVQSDGTTVGAYTDCAIIPSAIGAGFGQVSGSKYRIKKIRCRGQAVPQPLAAAGGETVTGIVRILLVQDTRPNGAQAQGEDTFLDMGNNSQINWAFMSMGAGQGGRFRILKDYFGKVDPSGAFNDAAATGAVSRNGLTFGFTYKPKVPIDVLLKANSATPTVASLSSCNIYLLAHTDVGTVTLAGCARCYFQG